MLVSLTLFVILPYAFAALPTQYLLLLHLATVTAAGALLALFTAAAAAAGAGGGREGGLSLLVTCSDPKNFIYTDPTQPHRV